MYAFQSTALNIIAMANSSHNNFKAVKGINNICHTCYVIWKYLLSIVLLMVWCFVLFVIPVDQYEPRNLLLFYNSSLHSLFPIIQLTEK